MKLRMFVATDVCSTFSRERPSAGAHRTRLAPYLSLVLQSHELAAAPVRVCLDDCTEVIIGRGTTRRIDVVRDDEGRCVVQIGRAHV